VSGASRLTFGFDNLIAGISFLIAVIGLFGFGELLMTIEEGAKFKGVRAKLTLREIGSALAELPRYWKTLLRSSAIGCWMGITPGGPTAASFMSYGIARRMAGNKAAFGKGAPEGIVAPETADHSAGSCALLPMLALGIPGSATGAWRPVPCCSSSARTSSGD
jgi:TctA family transporter